MDVEKASKPCGTKRAWIRETLGELIGTFLLVFIGNNSVAYVILNKDAKVSFLFIIVGYGFALTMGVLVCGGASGGHLNPAVTVAMVLIGRLKWYKMFHYIVAQYVGAFIAACFTFIVHIDVLKVFDGAKRTSSSAGIFVSFPNPSVTFIGALVDQTIGTFLLMLLICAITDPKNMEVTKGLIPLYVGLALIAVGCSMGINCGYPLNPARDLSPRLFIAMTGWGFGVFSTLDHLYWLVPILGPHIGAIIGAFTYVFFIELHISKGATGQADDD